QPENLMLVQGETSVYGDPLNPGLESPARLLRVSRPHLRLRMQTREAGQQPLAHEPLHQGRSQFVEFENDDALFSGHGNPSTWPFLLKDIRADPYGGCYAAET